jgi:riboflavin synthase
MIMFTGLVEHLGTVVSAEPREAGTSLVVDAGPLATGIAMGGSVAVNGACLTVVGIEGSRLSFQVGPETIKRTNLGSARAGSRVNLERPLRMGAELGGHWVQGHVDGLGAVLAREPAGEWEMVRFSAPERLLSMMLPQGSITVDGVSLTIVEVGAGAFTVMLIPHTLAVTTLGLLKIGDSVNLEADILARYTWKAIDQLIPAHLRQAGLLPGKP